jgi:superfamily II DNA helicase RecQ
VWRQKDAESVAENLIASGVHGGVVIYHGGMDSGARTKAQSKVSVLFRIDIVAYYIALDSHMHICC